MGVRNDFRTGLSVAGIELRRSLRIVLGDRRRVASTLFIAVAVGIPYLGVLGGLYAAGAALASGDAGVATAARGAFPGILAGLVALAVVQRAAESTVPDGAALLLTTARTRAVVVGELCSTAVTLYGTLVLLLAPGLVAFSLGAGTPATVAVALLAGVPVVAAATAVGYVVALVGALVTRRLPHVTALKFGAYVGVIVLLGLSGPVLAEAFGGGLAAALEPLARVPITDYALLALLGTPAGAVTPAGVGTALALAAVTVAGAAVSPTLAARVWFTEAGGGDRNTTERHAEMPWPFTLTPSLAVAWRYLLLARRAPRRLVHLTIFLFLLFPLGGVVVADPGAIPLVAAGAALFVGTLLSGGAFGLNPLGDESDVLPALLVTGVGGRRLIRGRLLAGLALGLPLAVPGAIGVWVGLDLSPRAGLGLLVGTPALSVAVGCIALGLGCAVPKFETESVFGVETVHPSQIPLLVYVYGGLVVVPAGLALVAAPVGDFVGGSLHLTALAAYALVVGGLAGGGYHYAVRRVGRYTY
jgi:hypothetical protein